MTTKASPEQLNIIGGLAAQMVRPGDTVGLGSGKAALAFVVALGRRIRTEHLKIVGVSTSLHTEKVAREAGIPLSTLEQVEALDITVDGADEIDPNLNLIKGGGGNLTREKVIAAITAKFVVVAGEEKLVSRLGTNFPIFVEVIEFARPVVTRKLRAMGTTVTQRMNPDGSPFLTDNGNPYLHAAYAHTASDNPAFRDPAAFDLKLHTIPGIVETGFFIGIAQHVIIARADGTVDHKTRPA